MKAIIYIIMSMLGVVTLSAQSSVDKVLASIEENNTTLKARKEDNNAQKLENKTGIYLANPEVEFNYLWGSPTNIGNRNDIRVSQTFDIPTITGMKNKLANQQNKLVDLQYKSDRINILLEAKQYCIELIYYNALNKELDIRLQHAQTIAKAYKDRLDRGDANILEYNKAQLNLSSIQGEMSRLQVERTALLAELQRLNGGVAVILEDTDYPDLLLPANFDDWYTLAEQKNPVLEYVKQEIEVSKKQISVSKAMGLPTFSTGYMREKVVGQSYDGLTVGMSIPLWENKNRVRQAEAAVRAAESRQYDSKQQFYGQLRTLYDRAYGLNKTAIEYRKSLASANSSNLLKKALVAGEISLLEYIVEMGLYYDNINQTLIAERDFQKAFAELAAIEL